MGSWCSVSDTINSLPRSALQPPCGTCPLRSAGAPRSLYRPLLRHGGGRRSGWGSRRSAGREVVNATRDTLAGHLLFLVQIFSWVEIIIRGSEEFKGGPAHAPRKNFPWSVRVPSWLNTDLPRPSSTFLNLPRTFEFAKWHSSLLNSYQTKAVCYPHDTIPRAPTLNPTPSPSPPHPNRPNCF